MQKKNVNRNAAKKEENVWQQTVWLAAVLFVLFNPFVESTNTNLNNSDTWIVNLLRAEKFSNLLSIMISDFDSFNSEN